MPTGCTVEKSQLYRPNGAEKEYYMSNLSKFKAQLTNDLVECLKAYGYEVVITEQLVQKINGELDALHVKDKKCPSVGAFLYTEPLLKESLQNGYDATLRRVTDGIADFLADVKTGALKTSNLLDDYESLKSNLFLSIINTERNAELLKDVPHFNMCDLSVIYRIKLETSLDGVQTVLIRNHMLSKWGITEERLKEDALKSAEVVNPAQITDMAELLPEVFRRQFGDDFPVPKELLDVPRNVMFIATTDSMVFGAAVIAYPDYLKRIAGYVNDSFWIIPSSIHECIVLPDRFQSGDPDCINDMIPNVNATCVDAHEILSDNLYHYDWEHNIFELKETYLSRIGKLGEFVNF